jgi:prolyl oligopeptidase
MASRGNTYAIDYFNPSPDGRLVAYGVSANGSEDAVLHVLDTATGRSLPDAIDRTRYAFPSWQPDGRSFFYKRQVDSRAPGAGQKERCFLHVVGTNAELDLVIFGYGASPTISVPGGGFPRIWSEDSLTHVFATFQDTSGEEVSYLVARTDLAGAHTPWKPLFGPDDKADQFFVHGDDLYVATHSGAPRSRILRTVLSAPDLAHAVTVVPSGNFDVVWMAGARDALYVQLRDAGIGQILRVPYDHGQPSRIALPLAGTIVMWSLLPNPSEVGALFLLTSWTMAPRLYWYDPTRGQVEDTQSVPPSRVDYSAVVSEEVQARSADGTLVPLSIIRRRSLLRDGSHPTLVEAYGAYGVIAEPNFDPMRLAWLERGGVLAVCHPRGGGEKGEQWALDGRLGKKVNTILDFLACGQWLIDENYTSSRHLAGAGFSAGGIAIGGAIARRPDLFAAAILRAGMVNALRFEQIPAGSSSPMNFGTVQTEAGFEMLRSIDAYHQIERRAYPAVLLTTGINDQRVSPWQMAKMAARLQAATTSGRPILLRVDYSGGHGRAEMKSAEESERADEYAFLLCQLQSL